MCVCLCVPVQRRGREGRGGLLRMAQVGLQVVLLTYDEPLAPASSWCFLTIRAQSFWWLWGQPSSGESPDSGTGRDGETGRGWEAGEKPRWGCSSPGLCSVTSLVKTQLVVPLRTFLLLSHCSPPAPNLLSEQPDLSFTSLYTVMVYSSASHTRL